MNNINLINIFSVIFITLNLRAAITSLGPLAHLIIDDYKISEASFGVLTSISLVAFGVFSIIAPMFARTKAMFISILLIGVGLFCRSFFGSFMLFFGMGLIGVGIAILNVLLPVFIKSWFKNVANMMSVYSFCLSVSAVIGVLGHYLLGVLNLRLVMFSYAIFVVFAIVSFFPHIKNNRLKKTKSVKFLQGFKEVLKVKKAWIITFQMGFQSAFYYTVVSFLPLFMQTKLNSHIAANLILLLQLLAVPSAYFVPRLFSKAKNKILYIFCICGLNIVGILLVLLSDNLYLMILASMCFAVPMGGIFGISLLFIASKTDKNKVVYLSAMAQSVGYMIAALAPFAFGLLKDFTKSYLFGEILLLVVAIVVLVLTKISNEIKHI